MDTPDIYMFGVCPPMFFVFSCCIVCLCFAGVHIPANKRVVVGIPKREVIQPEIKKVRASKRMKLIDEIQYRKKMIQILQFGSSSRVLRIYQNICNASKRATLNISKHPKTYE